MTLYKNHEIGTYNNRILIREKIIIEYKGEKYTQVNEYIGSEAVEYLKGLQKETNDLIEICSDIITSEIMK